MKAQLEQMKKEVSEAMELTDQYLKTEEVLDYIEQRSWELRNEFLFEMELSSEEIQNLEAKIYKTQKHVELLKMANPLCDAFVINPERKTINGILFTSIRYYPFLLGLRLTNDDTREANAALGMICFLIHLLQKKFPFLLAISVLFIPS